MTASLSRRTVLQGAAALTGTAISLPRQAIGAGQLQFAGVNIAGAEFGKIPGIYAKDYIYPSEQNIAYFAGLGFNLIRVPFLWERMQPKLFAPLDPNEQTRLAAVVRSTSAKGMHIVLDTHNYAKRRIENDDWATEHLIGSTQIPVGAFADYCGRLAETFKDEASVIFGLMNEPAQIEAEAWLPIANAGVASIRAKHAPQLVFVPGVAYTGAHSWFSAHNDLMAKLVDPANNFAFEVHQYLDRDSSGTSPDAVNNRIGSERIAAFQSWARANGFKAFLGEFGASSDAVSLEALRDLCETMAANPDVWIGWSAWAAGSWWANDYMFKLDASDGVIQPQTKILADFAHRVSSPGKTAQ